MALTKKQKAQDRRVKKEHARLLTIFESLTPDELAVCDGLIWQAARLRIMLDDMWYDISENGDVEDFSQSENLDPYERQRPVAQLFNTRDKNYQTTIKLLLDRLPDNGKNEDVGKEALKYKRERGGT